MSCYIVIFELTDSSRLEGLKDALKAYGTFCPLTPHSWAIKSATKSSEIRDNLREKLGPGDQLFVVRSGTEGAWSNSYGEKHNAWLKKNL